MRAMRVCWGAIVIAGCVAAVEAAPWRVGIGRIEITPSVPIRLAGYASRNRPSDGVLHPLWAKALAVEDQAGGRVVIVTIDLIGLNRTIADSVAASVQKQTGLARERIVLNCSHTHSGPVVGDLVQIAHLMNSQEEAVAAAYTKELEGKLASVVVQAIRALRPAKLLFAEGNATFGMNRRAVRTKDYVISPNPAGPVDHAVPVLAVRDEQDRLVAALFGYACHNTTLDIYQVNGDYAGFAQIAFERAHPGATGLFMIGCGADTNPEPRRKVELAEQHGKTLAAAVDRVLAGPMQPVGGRLAAALSRIDLSLVDPPTKAELEKRAADKSPYEQRLAKMLLQRLEKGEAISPRLSYPVQVVRFGDSLAMVAMAGEVVVDYSLRLKRELAGPRLWIAGYSNEVPAYIPSERVLKEGGYEAGGAMVYFGIHGPFKPGLEDRIVGEVKQLMERTKAEK